MCARLETNILVYTFKSTYMSYNIVWVYVQVSEWYKEGECGGGFYQLIATVLGENGQVGCVRCERGLCVYTGVRVVQGR